ncbi:MAG: SufD family Fe-S cluster assembly protein, partial [Candidatus Binatia bacterium]|nr:SufD family Fe-S cluster assembly protein [Candidatus Binatia bacterium]
MMGVAAETGSYLADFSRLEDRTSSNGLSWLREIRRAAIGRFAELGFPTTRHEDWKYTSVAPIAQTAFLPGVTTPQGISKERIREISVENWSPRELVFINGWCSNELSSPGSLDADISLRSMGKAFERDRPAMEPYLARVASYQDQPFTALNTAFMEDGGFLRVGRGVIVEQPIHLLFLTSPDKSPAISYPRNLVVVGDNSQVTIVESFIGLEEGVYWTNAVTEVVLGDHAVVEYLRFQRESEEAFHVATLQVSQGCSSSLAVQTFSVGGSLVRDDLNVVLEGEGGICTLNGLSLLSGRQHADTHTKIDHAMPNCTSRELYKGILADRSTGVFNGKIVVRQEA